MLNLWIKTVALLTLMLLCHCGPRHKDMRSKSKSWGEFEQNFDRKAFANWEKNLTNSATQTLVLDFKTKDGRKPLIEFLSIRFYEHSKETGKHSPIKMEKTFEKISDTLYRFSDIKFASDKWVGYIEVRIDQEWYSLVIP